MKILVVDDYLGMRKLIRTMLRQAGFQDVEEAEDGGTALEKLKSRNYDLVLSDWNMEPMSGLDLLRAARGSPALRSLPFIMVTGTPNADEDAEKEGADGCIQKPLSVAMLKEAIRRVFERRLGQGKF
jgi:two-component system chemotaxis response regulator CheY